MSDLAARLGTSIPHPARTITEQAPPRLRALLRTVVVEDLGLIEAYNELSDAAGQVAEDIWSPEWAAPRVRQLADELAWNLVYATLEKHAPRPLSGLESYESGVNKVLAQEGVAYEMVDGRFQPFDPEAADLDLDLNNPVEGEQFAPVRRQYQRAINALNAQPADFLAAIRESLNAVEALARILTGKPKASLGESIDKLLGSDPHRKALSQTLKALYGYSSTVPGARHGEHETVDIDYPEAAFVVRCAGSAIAMLLAERRRNGA